MATDTFIRPSCSVLGGDVGACGTAPGDIQPWVEVELGTNTFRTTGNTTTPNNLLLIRSGSQTSGRGFTYWNAGTPTADQYSELVFQGVDLDFGSLVQMNGPAVRIDIAGSQTSASFYGLFYERTNPRLELRKFNAETLVDSLGTLLGNSGVTTLVTGDRIRLTVSGSTLTATLNGATIIGPITDTALVAGSFGLASISGDAVGTVRIHWSEWNGAFVAGVSTTIKKLAAESTSSGSNTLTWKYTGVSSVNIYRSTDNITFTNIATVILGTKTYIDTTVAASTLYFYKLTDDGGTSFSNTASTVVQDCPVAGVSSPTFSSMPRAAGTVTTADFNRLVKEIESIDQAQLEADCIVCSVSGTLFLDYCSCDSYMVYLSENITAITMTCCERKRGQLHLVVFEGESYSVCGWPANSGFDSNQLSCEVTLTGKVGGSVYTFEFNRCKAVIGTGGGTTAKVTPLSIDCSATDTGAMGCQFNSDATVGINDHSVIVFANGGVEPYSWTCNNGFIFIGLGDFTMASDSRPGKKSIPASSGRQDIIWAPSTTRDKSKNDDGEFFSGKQLATDPFTGVGSNSLGANWSEKEGEGVNEPGGAVLALVKTGGDFIGDPTWTLEDRPLPFPTGEIYGHVGFASSTQITSKHPQFSELTFHQDGGAINTNSLTRGSGPCVRVNSAGTYDVATFYMARYATDRSSGVITLKVYNGVSTFGPGSTLDSYSRILVDNDKLKLVAVGSYLLVYLNDVLIIGPISNGAISAGIPGLAATADDKALTSAGGASSYLAWKNWRGGTEITDIKVTVRDTAGRTKIATITDLV